MTTRPELYGIRLEREAEFTRDWLNPSMTARWIAVKYGVSVNTACTTAISRLGLPRKKRKIKRLAAGTRERPTCFCCGGDTGGRCGCRIVVTPAGDKTCRRVG